MFRKKFHYYQKMCICAHAPWASAGFATFLFQMLENIHKIKKEYFFFQDFLPFWCLLSTFLLWCIIWTKK